MATVKEIKIKKVGGTVKTSKGSTNPGDGGQGPQTKATVRTTR